MPGWAMVASYGLTDAHITKDNRPNFAGQRKPSVPEHVASRTPRAVPQLRNNQVPQPTHPSNRCYEPLPQHRYARRPRFGFDVWSISRYALTAAPSHRSAAKACLCSSLIARVAARRFPLTVSSPAVSLAACLVVLAIGRILSAAFHK